MPGNLFSLIRERLPSADTPLLQAPHGRRLSYGQMLARSGQLSNLLVLHGIEPGDRIAVTTEKSPETLLLYLATLRAGAVYVPLNTGYTLAELDYFIDDAQPKLLVCDPARHPELRRIALTRDVGAVETLDAEGGGSLTSSAASAPPDFADVPRRSQDLAALLYTSGTTGRSKGAMLTHRALSSNALTLAQHWRFTGRDVLLHALPIYHTHGLFTAANTCMVAGASMLFLPRFDAHDVLRVLPQATVMMGVPTFYTRLLAHEGLTRSTCAHMRLFVSGSAPLLVETHHEFLTRTGHAILERYGMTETGMNTSNPYEGARIPGTVGLALPGVELHVAHPETGAVLGTGNVGVIEVRGPNVFAGYWRMPDKTQSEFRADGFFITGDLGKIDEGGYVHIVGRGKDLIITGGFNVYPKEIETEIDAHEGVIESAVIGLPHPDFGEGVTAIVVKQATARISEASILDALESRLAKFKLPKRVIFADELPRNAMGKVQKNVLRNQHADLYRPSVTAKSC
jgi:malonyl-CoA/methylmalonyl-CoA synthetase